MNRSEENEAATGQRHHSTNEAAGDPSEEMNQEDTDGEDETCTSGDNIENEDDSTNREEEMMAEATAAIVRAAAFGRSDSVLTLEDDDDDDDEDDSSIDENELQTSKPDSKRHHYNASFLYMQEASMEVEVENESTRIAPSGPRGHRRFSMSSNELSMDSSSVHQRVLSDVGELGTFQEGAIQTPPKDEESNFEAIVEGSWEDSVQELPVVTACTQVVLKSCGVLPLSLEELSRLNQKSEEALVSALMQSRDGGKLEGPDSEAVQPSLDGCGTAWDDEVLLLHSLFATFCAPCPSLDSISKILDMERSLSGSGLSGWKQRAEQRFAKSTDGDETPLSPLPEIPLPKDVLVSVSGTQKSSVTSLLCNKPQKHLLTLNAPFQLAFFRILIRLLTNETDAEYNEECLLTCDWWQERQDTTHKTETTDNRQTVDTTSKRSSSRPPRSNGNKKTSASKQRDRRKAFRQADVRLQRESSMSKRMKAAKRPNQIYTIVRFRSGAAWSPASRASASVALPKSNASSNLNLGQGSAVSALLRLLELLLEEKDVTDPKLRYPNDHLVAPVVRLLGLSCTAGVSVRELRRLLSLTTRPLRESEKSDLEKSATEYCGPRVCVPAFARLLLVRALSTAAEGASQSSLLVGKASPRYFFTFGRGSGLVRNMKSLSTWPFRNDFGMAVWFRAESFIDTTASSDSQRYPTLLSISTENSGGIEVSLMPPEEASSTEIFNVTVLAVTVRDSHAPDDYRRVVLKGCVLLPRVWYHVAVRHTRSRLQGVFSLATRQQISIMLDGKVMLTEDLAFPEVTDSYQVSGTSSKLLSPGLLRSSASNDSNLNVTMTFGSDFDGQTGPLYVFNDHISEATLRALFVTTAGTGGVVKQQSFSDEVWDSSRGEVAKRVSAYGVDMTKADAEEIVVTRQASGSGEGISGKAVSYSPAEVLDLNDGETHEDGDLPPELSKSAFSSKLFLVWDPKRTEGSVALELHSGAHVHMDMDRIQTWYVEGAKQVIQSIGGIQAILPLFHTILSGDIERNWRVKVKKEGSNKSCDHIFDEVILFTTVPSLLSLLASFLRNHSENARETLRCGGIDIVEQILLKNKTQGTIVGTRRATNGSTDATATLQFPKRSLVSVLSCNPGLSNRLVDSLLDLRLACSHDVGLEAKVLSRLLFNVPLWLGGANRTPGVALHAALLPVMSEIAKSSPKKVRDCVGVRDMIESLREYTNVGETSDEKFVEFVNESKTVLFDRSASSGLDENAPLTINERRHVVDIILGMAMAVMATGATASHLSSLLCYISQNLETDWEQDSLELKGGNGEILRLGSRQERYLITNKACTILLFLLRGRPVVPNLFESLMECCEGVHGFASWLLCIMVNSFDDSIRSLGVRCLDAYLDVAIPAAESFLNVTETADVGSSVARDGARGDISPLVHKKAVKMLSATMTNVGKGLAVIGNTGMLSGILPPSKLSIKIVYKLLWHLLKCHRTRIGDKTHAAVVDLLLDDRVTLSSSIGFLVDGFVGPNDIIGIGYKLNMEWANAFLAEARSVGAHNLRDTPAISTVLRLLRFLPDRMKERWLVQLHALVSQSPSSLVVLMANPDWQPCLFLLISEIVEEINTGYLEDGNAEIHHSVSNKIDLKSQDLHASMDGRSDDLDDEASSSKGQSRESEIPTHKDEIDNGFLRKHEVPPIVGRDGERSLVQTRFNLSLKLYAALLGHSIRQGGDKAFQAVETAASMQRVCVNGHEVFSLILSHLLTDLIENGTISNIDHLEQPADQVNEEYMMPLKLSAGIVTKAILSNGRDGMDMATAVRQWRCLRHLTAVIVAVITKSGFGVDELFDYRNQHASALDSLSGGLHGIRLPDGNVPGIAASACIDRSSTAADENTGDPHRTRSERENYRLVCVTLAAQLLLFLDAFIFPDSLDASLPASQLHGLALVRSTESRLGLAQGPLLASLVRLSLLLLCHLEPSSVKFLQCCSRLRCFLHWTLELIRESVALAGYSAAFHDLTAPLDRLVLAIVLHAHRALSRCSAVLFEIEASSFEAYFPSEEAQRKSYRRLFRVVFELREMVLAAYRGRNEVLRAALSLQAFDALQTSLEKTSPSDQNHEAGDTAGAASKEAAIRLFLTSPWVTGFHDIDIHGSFAVPEQVANGQIFEHRTASHRGLLAIEELALESSAIVEDFNRGLDASFEAYCEGQRKWADTDAVRELEYEGDMTVKRLSGKHRSDIQESSRMMSQRLDAMKSRWDAIEREVSELWRTKDHWKLAEHTDRLSRRILLVRNRHFKDHKDASYELMLGREREKANRQREERLQKQQEEELSAVVRRNEAAFVPYGETEAEEDELEDEELEPTTRRDSELLSEEHIDKVAEPNSVENDMVDDDWDPLESEEVAAAKGNIDPDAWAKAFIWSDSESIVARFDQVVLVTLQTLTEGKILLTSHGLYFHPTGDETNVMTKERFVGSASDRRWRLSRLTEVHGRRYMLRLQALELFFSDTHELFLNFTNGTRERDRFYAKLRNSCKVPMLWSPKSLNPKTVLKKSKITDLWKKRKISNFQYLMHLNFMAGRSFNDISQYPVFPWVLSDYTSETLDLNDSRVYRDLSKPVGALNPDRLAQLIERYNDLDNFGFPEQEKFLYGSHYSSPGVVLHYLIRQEPFTTMAIQLQSGRFDCPDRLFFDIAGCWNNCLTSSSDVKELIPEFFTCPEILLNTNNFPLGETQDKRDTSHVALPPWAKGSAYEFVRIHRLALESEYVSQNLNHWIDLIFGYKQRGPEAAAAHNIFHYLSYEGSVDLDKITDEVDRVATESHIQNFGQTPCQLLVKEPHPRRYGAAESWKPLIDNVSVPKQLRCHTPAKQFGGKRHGHARGAVLSTHVMTDTVVVVYADLSVGTYRWSPARNGGSLKMDKHRTLARNELSTSRSAMKRGSTAPQSMDSSGSHLAVGNWSFALTLGGFVKENLRRKSAVSRLNPSKDMANAEASALLLNCGYWDNMVKVHSIDGMRLRCSESGGHRGPILCLDIGNDGALMVTGGQDATCRVWVVDHPDMSIALSDGYVKTALDGFTDGKKEQLLMCCHVLWGHETAVTCLSLSSELDLTVSGSIGGTVCVHTIRRGSFVRSIRPAAISGYEENPVRIAVRKLALDSNGIFVAHMADGGLHTYTVNGVLLCSENAGEVLHAMKICSTGEVLVSGGNDGHVVIRTVHDLQIHSTLDLSRHGPVRCLSLTPEELNPIPQFLFIGSDDGMITVVDKDSSSAEKASIKR